MYDEQESRDEANAAYQIEADKFDAAMDRYELDDQYADYLMNKTSLVICNGDGLIRAMESGDYYDDFKEHYLGENA